MVRDYLGMTFEFKNKEVTISMKEYVQDLVREFPIKFHGEYKMTCPAGIDLFKEDTGKKLGEKEKEIFHRTVAKALFLCKRARPDIQTVVSVLCTRVKNPGKQDWNKLVRLIKYLQYTIDDDLVLKASRDDWGINWHVDPAFAVHPDMKSHTGATMSFKKW